MSEELRTWMINVVKELQKHSDRDQCYGCKQLLKDPFAQKVMKAAEALK